MRNETKTGMAILVFFMALYSLLSIGHYGGDGYQDYLTAESIVLDGNLSLYDRPGDKDELEYLSQLGVKGNDGRTYSSRSVLGMPFLLAPFYFAGHILAKFCANVPHDYVTMLMVSFANPLLMAFSCLMVYCVSRKFGYSVRISSILSMIFGLCTMAPVYVRTGFAGPALSLFMLLSLYYIFSYSGSFKVRYLILSAAFLSVMFFCKASSLIFFPCFLLYLVWVLKDAEIQISKKAAHVIFFSGILTSAFLLAMAVNYSIFGNALSFGKINAIDMGKRIAGASHMLKGCYYYLLSTGKGFLIFNIPVIFAFISAKKAFLKDKKKTVLFFLIFIVKLLFYVKSFSSGSLFSWGPRYLLSSVGPLLIMCGSYLENIKGIMRRVIFMASMVISFLIILPCMFINQSKYYSFVVEKLGIDEYMINFIPDLSPIKGAWYMFASRISLNFGGGGFPFVYAPDYRLVEPVSAGMEQYNYIDMWITKVMETAPAFGPVIIGVSILLAVIAIIALKEIFRDRLPG